MSEVVVQPNTQGGTRFGLQVINEKPAKLSQNSPTAPVIVTGGAGKNSFKVTSTATTVLYKIQTGLGNNLVVTGAGADTLSGGSGNDTLDSGSGNDSVLGGSGNDSVLGGSGNDFVLGGSGNDILDGGSGNDILDGEIGNDSVLGGTGDDALYGGVGDDTLGGNAGNDSLYGGDGNDYLLGGEGNDILQGGVGNDTLRGGAGNDSLGGADGDDILIPGSGSDTLRGGAGSDRFRLEADTTVGNRGQLNRITDFVPKEDVIEISKKLLPGSGLKTGRLDASDFQAVTRIGVSNSQAAIVYEKNSGILYYNPSQTGAVSVPLLRLDGKPNVSANDVLIF